jgi:hypothetical protein
MYFLATANEIFNNRILIMFPIEDAEQVVCLLQLVREIQLSNQ